MAGYIRCHNGYGKKYNNGAWIHNGDSTAPSTQTQAAISHKNWIKNGQASILMCITGSYDFFILKNALAR
jgi:hypothetical protein